MLVRGVIDHELDNGPKLAPLGFLHEAAEVLHRSEVGVYVAVFRDGVTVVASGRRIEWQQPEGGDAQILQIVELFRQSDEVADAVAVAVRKSLDVKLVDDGILEPEFVFVELTFGFGFRKYVHDTTRYKRHRKTKAGSCSGSMR